MFFIAASAFLKALGWALVNSVWQYAICWLLYSLFAGHKLSAAARHTLALGLLFTGAALFLANFSWTYYHLPPVAYVPVGIAVENTAWYNRLHTISRYLDLVLPYWSLLYLGCIAALFVKLCFFVRRAGTLQHNGITKMDPAFRLYIKRIAAQLGIRQPVHAFLSIHIDTPQVIGFLKPVILVPAACLANLTTAQLEAILLHEMVHIKRNDYLANLFVASIEILFFFNPFVKQLTASIRKEREYSCDDTVLQFQYQPRHYASALLALEKNRLAPVTYGIAASGKNQRQLLTRVERIVGINNRQPGFSGSAACLLALLLLGLVAGIRQVPAGFLKNTPAGALHYTIRTTKAPVLYKHANTVAKKAVVHTIDKPGGKETAAATPPAAGTIADELLTVAASVTSDNEANGLLADAQVLAARQQEVRDFSLLPEPATPVPETPAPSAPEEPYVPANSFSYKFMQDTAMPKVKGESYTERQARLSMVKAQKALAAIDWQKIEKDLRSSPQVLIKLKKELAEQLQQLNWQKINLDVQQEMQLQGLDQLKEAARQEQAVRQYQQSEMMYNDLQKQLTEQAQVIKITGQRALESKKAADQQQQKLQQEMKKRRIIYI